MPYIGKTELKSSDVVADSFTGNGSTTAFTLSKVPPSDQAVLVSINGVKQHTDAYSISGTTLTLSDAPDSGDAIEAVSIIDIGEAAGDSLPTQTGNSGKFLTTDGTDSSWGDISLGDNVKAQFGASDDLQIYHDGNSVIKEAGTGVLEVQTNGSEIQLTGNAGTDYMLRAISNGAIKLYHDNSLKLETTSSGIDVTGSVTATEFNIAEWLTSTNVLETNAAGQTGARLRAAVSDAGTPTFSFNDDTDTGIYTSGSNTLNFSTGGSERLRIDSSGNVLVGKTVSDTGNSLGFEARGNGLVNIGRDGGEPLLLNRNNSDGGIVLFRKDGTTVGNISTWGGEIAIGRINCALLFDDGSNKIKPHSVSSNTIRDNALDLGHSNARFDDIYATNSSIQTSDRNEKQDIEELSEAEQRVALACKGLLRKFRWIDKVEAKGDEARIHFGIIAQDLQDAFDAEGLDAGRYAMFISSTWTDEETGEERTRLGVRYPELLAFIIASL